MPKTYNAEMADATTALAESEAAIAGADAAIAVSAVDQDYPESYALDMVREFLSTIIYATDEQLDALTLCMAMTHCTPAFNTVARVLVTSDMPESGKTTVLDAADMLALNPWMADPTSYALRSKFNEPKPVCLLVDEISKIFGESGLSGRQNPLYKILAEGYRKSAKLSLSVNRVAVDVPCFGVAFLAGLRTAVPSDIRSRSIIIEMRPIPRNVHVDDSLNEDVQINGRAYGEALHAWVGQRFELIRTVAFNGLRNIHPKLKARRRQVWGPLFAIAGVAGNGWEKRVLRAFEALALDASDRPVLTPEQQILLDTAEILETEDRTRILSGDLLDKLREIPDRDIYLMSDEMFMRKMAKALGPSKNMRDGDFSGKGREAAPILVAADKLRKAIYAVDDAAEETDPVEEEFAKTPWSVVDADLNEMDTLGQNVPALVAGTEIAATQESNSARDVADVADVAANLSVPQSARFRESLLRPMSGVHSLTGEDDP